MYEAGYAYTAHGSDILFSFAAGAWFAESATEGFINKA